MELHDQLDVNPLDSIELDGTFHPRCSIITRVNDDTTVGARSFRRAIPDLDRSWRASPYVILEEIGRGGMGIVYKARQVELDRIVALKMIRSSCIDQEQRTRFLKEAAIAARLQHANIVQIHEVGEHDDGPYLSMEYVDGGSLEQTLSGQPLSSRDAAALVETLAEAVHFAHEHGIVHRDLKPANVLLTKTGTPKITDFGLAKCLTGDDQNNTCSGAILGTPVYMAPEQARGRTRDVQPAADVYALGAILYELSTGRAPFKATSLLETLEQVRSKEPVPPTRLCPKISRSLETICLVCLQKEPASRYASAKALADDLRQRHPARRAHSSSSGRFPGTSHRVVGAPTRRRWS